MKSMKISLMAALVGMLAIAALAVPSVNASPDVGDIKLYDTGNAATAAYVFTVTSPGSMSLEDDNLTFTVSSYPVVIGTGTEANWYVHIHIYDGTTNLSANKTLAVTHDGFVYGNQTWANPGNLLTDNTSAKITIEVQNAAFAIKDVYVGDFSIYSTGMSQAVYVMIPMIVTLAVVAAILPMFKKIGKKR